MDPLEGLEDCRFCEVYLCLPPDWPMAPELRLDRAEGWPVRLPAELAQYPHRSGKWIWFGHTCTEAPIQPYVPGVGFVSALLGPPISMPWGSTGSPWMRGVPSGTSACCPSTARSARWRGAGDRGACWDGSRRRG